MCELGIALPRNRCIAQMFVGQYNISLCNIPVTDKLAPSSHTIYKQVDCTGSFDLLNPPPQSPHVHKHLQLPYLLIMRASDVSFLFKLQLQL